MKEEILLSQAIKEDKAIGEKWMRDTKAWAERLAMRREQLLPHRGMWSKYLDGVGIQEKQAYRLLHSVEAAITTPISNHLLSNDSKQEGDPSSVDVMNRGLREEEKAPKRATNYTDNLKLTLW